MSYINTDEIVLNYDGLAYIDPHDFEGTAKYFYNQIKAMPPADVKPVVHGHWILHKPRRLNRNATYKCSVCKKLRSSYYNDVGDWEYCPCGAKMR